MTELDLLREWCDGRVTKESAETEMDYRENQRRAVAGSPLRYRPERDRQGWLIVLVYALATAVVCWFTRGGRL